MSEITYSTIEVAGDDAFEFLQAQLTIDLNDLPQETAGSSARAAWCNPKGRVICMPTVTRDAAGFSLSLPADLEELVLQRLTLFRFRSKVEFAAQAAQSSYAENALQNLRAGIPEIALAQSEKFTPHMLNLDLLEIVSLDKGCYPGQEIVARTHYRGASKRRCLYFQSSAAVLPGDKVSDGDREIGEVVNSIGTDLLAVIPVTSTENPLTVGDATLRNVKLPYSF